MAPGSPQPPQPATQPESVKESKLQSQPPKPPTAASSASTPPATAPKFALSRTQTPLRSLPPGTILLHATNALGVWGAGIAAEMATIFPAARRRYTAFCLAAGSKVRPATDRWPTRREHAMGKCLLIPPQAEDVRGGAPAVWIACVFTSFGYGRGGGEGKRPGKDAVGVIVEQTVRALGDFRRQVDELATKTKGKGSGGGEEEEEEEEEGKTKVEGGTAAAALQRPVVVCSPRFNSGAFQVPWERTERAILEKFEGWDGTWFIMDPPPS